MRINKSKDYQIAKIQYIRLYHYIYANNIIHQKKALWNFYIF